MISCDSCKAEPATRYRVTIGNGMPGEDFAEIDLCVACAKSCFANVFNCISYARDGKRVTLSIADVKKEKRK